MVTTKKINSRRHVFVVYLISASRDSPARIYLMEMCFQIFRRLDRRWRRHCHTLMRIWCKNYLLKNSTYMCPWIWLKQQILRAHLLSANQKSRWRAIYASRKNHEKIPWKRKNNRLETLEVFFTHNVQHGESFSLFTDRSSIWLCFAGFSREVMVDC